MWVTINGFREEIEDDLSLADVIERYEEYDVNLVVELNNSFVPKERYGSIRLKEGDRVELIHPAFGG